MRRNVPPIERGLDVGETRPAIRRPSDQKACAEFLGLDAGQPPDRLGGHGRPRPTSTLGGQPAAQHLPGVCALHFATLAVTTSQDSSTGMTVLAPAGVPDFGNPSARIRLRQMARILIRSHKNPFTVADAESTLERNLIGSNTGNLVFSQAAYRLLSTAENQV